MADKPKGNQLVCSAHRMPIVALLMSLAPTAAVPHSACPCGCTRSTSERRETDDDSSTEPHAPKYSLHKKNWPPFGDR